MPEVCRLKVFTDEHDKQTQQPWGVRSSFSLSHFHEKPHVIPWQRGLISRCAVGSLTAMTLLATGAACILLRATVSVGVCLYLEACGKKLCPEIILGGVCLSVSQRGAGHSSKPGPCTAKFTVIFFSQVLEALGAGVALEAHPQPSEINNKQERPSGRPTR